MALNNLQSSETMRTIYMKHFDSTASNYYDMALKKNGKIIYRKSGENEGTFLWKFYMENVSWLDSRPLHTILLHYTAILVPN